MSPRAPRTPQSRSGSLMCVPASIPRPRSAARPTAAGQSPGYYRFPAIHGDQIVFCSDDDLWVVGAAGGVARRLTVSKAAVARPVFSPDGRWIAFTGTDEGGVEVYLVPAEGGEPRRLTHLGANTLTLGWSANATEVLCASDAGQPFLGHSQLFAVPADGGPPRSLELGPARDVALEPGGRGMAIARNAGDPARWKRYRGGTTGTLWVDARGDGTFRQILGVTRITRTSMPALRGPTGRESSTTPVRTSTSSNRPRGKTGASLSRSAARDRSGGASSSPRPRPSRTTTRTPRATRSCSLCAAGPSRWASGKGPPRSSGCPGAGAIAWRAG
jgi:hypothetical protein